MLRIRFYFFPDVADMYHDCSEIFFYAVRIPNVVEDLLWSKNPIGIFAQENKQIEFLCCQIHRLAAHDNGVRIEIDDELAERYGILWLIVVVRGAAHVLSSEMGFDSGHQLGRAERLGDVVVSADGETQHLVNVFSFAANKEDGGIAVLPT